MSEKPQEITLERAELLKIIRGLVEFPFPRICKHAAAALEIAGLIGEKEIAQHLCRSSAGDMEVLGLLEEKLGEKREHEEDAP